MPIDDTIIDTVSESVVEESHKQSFAVLSDMLFSIERASATNPINSRVHHYHDYYELYYLYSGDRYYFIKDNTYHIKPGSFVLVKPYDTHSTGRYSEAGYDRILITFKKSFLTGFLEAAMGLDLFETFENDTHVVSLSFQDQSTVEAMLFSMLEEDKTRKPGYDLILKSSLFQLLLIISRYSGQLDSAAHGYYNTAHKTVSEVAAYINNNYFEDITLSSIQEKFFISPCYFSRTFKKLTGIPFIEYVNGVRVKEAQRLLKKSHMSIVEVAEAVGFKSTTHFGRIFKSIVGQSPMEYKKHRSAAKG